MTTAERRQVILRMRKAGYCQREIAAQVGVSQATVHRALMDPEALRASIRRDNARRHEAKLAHGRSASGVKCAGCGTALSRDSARKGYERCRACFEEEARAAANPRHELIAAMHRAGRSLAEIAAAAGTSSNAIGHTLAKLRARGWDIPPKPGYESRSKHLRERLGE